MSGCDAVVLVGEEVAGAPDAGLHLVGDQQRAVLVQQSPAAAARKPGGGTATPLPWIGSISKRGDVAAAQLALAGRRGRRTAIAVSGSSGPKPLRNSSAPFTDSEPAVRPWKAWSSRGCGCGRWRSGRTSAPPRPPRCRCCRSRPGRGAAPWPAAASASSPASGGAVELGQVGQVGVEHVVHGLADHRVVAPEREHAEAGQHVEVVVAVLVVEVGALGPGVDLVEPDRRAASAAAAGSGARGAGRTARRRARRSRPGRSKRPAGARRRARTGERHVRYGGIDHGPSPDNVAVTTPD